MEEPGFKPFSECYFVSLIIRDLKQAEWQRDDDGY